MGATGDAVALNSTSSTPTSGLTNTLHISEEIPHKDHKITLIQHSGISRTNLDKNQNSRSTRNGKCVTTRGMGKIFKKTFCIQAGTCLTQVNMYQNETDCSLLNQPSHVTFTPIKKKLEIKLRSST